jgi:signal transduction histidine kinase
MRIPRNQSQDTAEIEHSLARLGVARVRLFSLVLVFIGLILLVIDFLTNPTYNGLIPAGAYLVLDLSLALLAGLFLFLANRTLRTPGAVGRRGEYISLAFAISVLVWSGITTALERTTHNSQISLVLAILVLGAASYIRWWRLLPAYAAGLLSLAATEKILVRSSDDLLSEHIVLVSTMILGLAMAKTLYNSREANLRSQQLVTEKNEQLKREIEARAQVQREMEVLQESLKQQVKDRTRDLVTKNEELVKESQERKRTQEKLLQAQKMESIGRLAGGVAHDYNNISSIIVGYSELLLDGMAADDPNRRDVREILDAAKRSARISRQLLTFARKQKIEPQVLDLGAYVAKSLTMLERLVGEDVSIDFRPSGEHQLVEIDPSQVDQIVANLCVNARDAIEGTGTVTIGIETSTAAADGRDPEPGQDPDDFVVVVVGDDGCGIPPEHLDRIFDPFFTTKAPGVGTGLGLATVFGIAEQNGGFVSVSSEPGAGTKFRIHLPKFIGNDANPEQEVIEEAPLGKGEVILLVEDDPSILRLSERLLADLGYQVIAESNPVQAAESLSSCKPEPVLLMTDVIMPEMNGRQLADVFAETFPRGQTLFVSGYTADIVRRRGGLDNGVNVLEKPFTRFQLASKLREIIDLSTADVPIEGSAGECR